MFFFNWNVFNKSNQDDVSDASQDSSSAATQPAATQPAATQPADDYLEPTQPKQATQSEQSSQPVQSTQSEQSSQSAHSSQLTHRPQSSQPDSMQPMQSDHLVQQQSTPQEPTDYVDAYTPPARDIVAAENGDVQPHLKYTPWNDDQDAQAVVDQATKSVNDQDVQDVVDQAAKSVNDQDAQDVVDQESENAEQSNQEEFDQSIVSQNIFDLLGAADGEESEKEAFLDELQQVVWEDFIQTDVQTLLTEAEYAEFSQIVNQQDTPNEEKQEKAIKYLENLLPDLEEILLNKALQLKQDLVWERVAGMKEYFAGQDQQLQAVVQAEALFRQGRWRDGAQLLNTLS
jgi:hypothetical protein